MDLCCAGNGNNIVTLCEEPSESDLTGSDVVLLTDLLQAVSKLQDHWKIIFIVSECSLVSNNAYYREEHTWERTF